MIGRSLESPDAQAAEATVAEAPLRFEDFFGAEHARLFGALCFVTGDRHEAEEIMQDGLPPHVGLARMNRQGELVVFDVASGEETVVLGSDAPLPMDGVLNVVRGFSPQGDRILFVALVRGDGGGIYNSLYSIGVDGSEVRWLVDGAMQGQWRPR